MLRDTPPPALINQDDLQHAVEEGCDIIMDAATQCNTPQIDVEWNEAKPRWARILDYNDPKVIWRSLNWRGTFDNKVENQPPESMFKEHFEKLLTHDETGVPIAPSDFDSSPYIPLLDDPFEYSEIDSAISSLNKNKSYTGICPGILKVLPMSWVLFLLTLFNTVFIQCFYAVKLCYNKLFVLFKSGNRFLCDNYRGISIMDSLAKIYDILILNRLSIWLNIDKCQAGAQKGRSCLEQICTLRMLCDYAVCKKLKLYILFIDYSNYWCAPGIPFKLSIIHCIY